MAFDEQLHSQPSEEAGGVAAGEPDVVDGFRLTDGEEVVETLGVDGSDRFVLTTRRVIYIGGEDDRRNWSFAQLSQVSSVEVARAPRERSTLVWGVLGLVAAVGIWQVATNDTVGIAGGIVMAALAAVLLWDYYLRAPPSQLLFRADGKDIGGPLNRSAEANARAFGDRVFEQKLSAGKDAEPGRAGGATRRYRYPAY